MNALELLKIAQKGEDSRVQFKVDIDSPDGLAAEIVSFLNARGGVIYVGIGDGGERIFRSMVSTLEVGVERTCNLRVPIVAQLIPLFHGQFGGWENRGWISFKVENFDLKKASERRAA